MLQNMRQHIKPHNEPSKRYICKSECIQREGVGGRGMQRGGVDRAGPMGTTDSEFGSDWLPSGERGAGIG